MTIAENGPSIFKAGLLLSNTMSKYWKETSKPGKWHFVREPSTSRISDYGTSYGKTTMRLMIRPSKYSIVNKI